jgi:hypothetical protein
MENMEVKGKERKTLDKVEEYERERERETHELKYPRRKAKNPFTWSHQ